ncbi:MAG: box helicase domain protein [Herbinix sp.]|jgi:superfamily II DNA/RNA helicase|nr:box helicase domain protein [Herbinix sp.]
MNSNFSDLGISSPILKAIEEMGFETPTNVQSKAIPHVLNREDLIVMSKTGSGKTAVFGIPILQMTDPKDAGPQALILTPTRELAVQVDGDLKQMSKHLQHRTTAVYGQHSMNVEIQALNKGISIVTGTPGRVFDHINQGNLLTKNIRFLVLDEADRMLDMGFIDQVVRIIKTLPRDRVTLLFSATIPTEIKRICREYMKSPLTIEIESETMTVDSINQVYYRVERNEKCTQLNRLLLFTQPESCMIFCNTRAAVDRVQSFLSQKGYGTQALHGDIPQGRRLKTIQQFKKGEFHILVATDVAARGIHVDDLSLVINYDVPNDMNNYVHRIGRTGRAGNGGRAITLASGEDIMSLYEIEEHIGTMIEEEKLPSDADLNERRAGAESWIKAKSKRAPEHHLPNPKPKTPNPKATKPPQHHSNSRQQTAAVKASPKITQKTSAEYSAKQSKPVNPTVKALESYSNDTSVAIGKVLPETTQKSDAIAKKPFLQRVLQRILGK